MSDVNRRDVLRLLAVAPVASAFTWAPAEVAAAAARVDELDSSAPAGSFAPAFFTPHEWQTVSVLVDMIIPKDARSGSATEAKVPEFMDFMMNDGSDNTRLWMRGGLAWLDAESRHRSGSGFAAATSAQRAAILDDIAWPARAPAEMSHGVSFFNRFRDLTASGFFSSAIGYKDLDFRGNVFVPEWTGCPEPALRKLGVSYDA
jgi:hypothetical protein